MFFLFFIIFVILRAKSVVITQIEVIIVTIPLAAHLFLTSLTFRQHSGIHISEQSHPSIHISEQSHPSNHKSGI